MYRDVSQLNHYLFLSIDKRFGKLPPAIQKEYRDELAAVIEQNMECTICAYSPLGLKGIFKFELLVQYSKKSSIQALVRKLFSINMGRYLELSYTMIGFPQVSQYIAKQICNVIRAG